MCAGNASGEGVAACAGWREAYYCLLMLEKVDVCLSVVVCKEAACVCKEVP